MILALLPFLVLAPAEGGSPWRQPQLAEEGNTAVLTFGSGNDVYATVSRDGGRTFAVPQRIGSAGVLSLGRHRGPRVVIRGGVITIAAIAGEKGKGQDGELWAWRSTDLGKSWAKPSRITDVPGAAREGLHTLAAGPNGLLFAAWLDLRVKGTRLMGALSKDNGATWSANFPIYESPDGNICECCHPSAAVAADGTLHVQFRNWQGGSRDMWLATSRDGGRTFSAVKTGQGTWQLNACPMDGGGIAVQPDGTVLTSWRREQQIFWTSGTVFHAPGWHGKDSALALSPGGQPAIAWTDGTRLLLYDGKAVSELAPNGAYVSLSGNLAAWESGSGITVRRLR